MTDISTREAWLAQLDKWALQAVTGSELERALAVALLKAKAKEWLSK